MIKGSKHSNETKAKISAAHKGKKLSPEHRAKLSVAGKNRKHSKETKAKMSVAGKGKIISIETRKKMSAAKKGKKLSSEHRTKMIAGLKGRKLSLEHRAKLSATHIGKHHSEKSKRKISIAQVGSKHPRWLGGISKLPYAWTFNAELKEEVRRRDKYKCQLCNTPQLEYEVALSVHHIDYDKKNSDPVNLITLCILCHARTNVNREHWKKFFRELILRKELERCRGPDR